MIKASRLLAALAVASALPLASCISVLPKQPKPNALYRLPLPDVTVTLPVDVVILEPDAPRLIGGRSIAAIGPQGGLRVVSGVAWADRSTRLLQIGMINTFSDSGPGLALDDAAGINAAAELFWRVDDFSLLGDRGYCSLQLTLLEGRTRQPIAQTRINSESQSEGESAEARAHALAEAGRECVRQGAEFVAQASAKLADED